MNLKNYSETGRRSSAVEQLIRNQQVGGSIPLAGFSQNRTTIDIFPFHGAISHFLFQSSMHESSGVMKIFQCIRTFFHLCAIIREYIGSVICLVNRDSHHRGRGL